MKDDGGHNHQDNGGFESFGEQIGVNSMICDFHWYWGKELHSSTNKQNLKKEH